jgi:hypothetical protein
MSHLLSDATALATFALLAAVILHEFRRREDPVILCRWCGAHTRNPIWWTRGTVSWAFCSTECSAACLAIHPTQGEELP